MRWYKYINTKRLLGAASLADAIDQWAGIIFTRSGSKKKRLHPELASIYRCICRAVPFDFLTESRTEYHMQLRVVRFKIAEGV